MITKTSIAVTALTNGDTKEALRIVKDFKIGYTKTERAVLSRGYECMVRPEFYRQLGTNCEACILAAVELLNKKLLSEA